MFSNIGSAHPRFAYQAAERPLAQRLPSSHQQAFMALPAGIELNSDHKLAIEELGTRTAAWVSPNTVDLGPVLEDVQGVRLSGRHTFTDQVLDAARAAQQRNPDLIVYLGVPPENPQKYVPVARPPLQPTGRFPAAAVSAMPIPLAREPAEGSARPGPRSGEAAVRQRLGRPFAAPAWRAPASLSAPIAVQAHPLHRRHPNLPPARSGPSRLPFIPQLATAASSNPRPRGFNADAGHTPWTSPAAAHEADPAQWGSSPPLHPPTESAAGSALGRISSHPAGFGAGASPATPVAVIIPGRRPAGSNAQPRQLPPVRGWTPYTIASTGATSETAEMHADPSEQSLYSEFDPGMTIPSIASPNAGGRVHEQDPQRPAAGSAIEDNPRLGRGVYRNILRDQVGLNDISFSQITAQNSRDAAGQILARRVLAMAPESTKIERINGLMEWVNATWEMHRQALAAEQAHGSESPPQDNDQLRNARRQLRLFLGMCDEGNVLGFGIGYPRPQTDSELDAFLNSERFALLVGALRDVHNRVANASSRTENVRVTYSPAPS